MNVTIIMQEGTVIYHGRFVSHVFYMSSIQVPACSLIPAFFFESFCCFEVNGMAKDAILSGVDTLHNVSFQYIGECRFGCNGGYIRIIKLS